jgi:hypothetical protein
MSHPLMRPARSVGIDGQGNAAGHRHTGATGSVGRHKGVAA